MLNKTKKCRGYLNFWEAPLKHRRQATDVERMLNRRSSRAELEQRGVIKNGNVVRLTFFVAFAMWQLFPIIL